MSKDFSSKNKNVTLYEFINHNAIFCPTCNSYNLISQKGFLGRNKCLCRNCNISFNVKLNPKLLPYAKNTAEIVDNDYKMNKIFLGEAKNIEYFNTIYDCLIYLNQTYCFLMPYLPPPKLEHPYDKLCNLKKNRDRETANFISRTYKEMTAKALLLKTEKGRMNRKAKYFEELSKYQDSLSEVVNQFINELMTISWE